MKILYLITKSNFGDAQRYVFDLATGAKAQGHDIVVAYGVSPQEGSEGILGEKLREAGVRTLSLPTLARDVNTWKDLRSFFAVLELLREEKPDILHLNSSKVGGLGALAGRVYNTQERLLHLKDGGHPVRIIFTGHGWAFNEERTDTERILIATLHWLTIHLTHRTIAVSRKTREQIARTPFVWHKINVIHNGVGTIELLPKGEALTELLGKEAERLLKTNPLVIGIIAELHKNQGLNYALEGLSLLLKQTDQPILCIVIGEGEERASLETLRNKLGLGEHVFFAGSHTEGARLLSAFDIFLLPPITEAFPYALLEAGKAGLPIIATAVGGIPEVIDDMQSGILIQSKNPGEIARALAYLISNPDKREQLGQNIATRIRDRFSVEQMIEETLKLYASKNTEEESS
ncbi:MAG: Second mannosyl transferase [Candidatus Giovannonibacteria bacterium GW2011_GWA2_53_7]|uniref:Second mannosyl transferase n=1 Tax=Candidatus Giovannonibacteria bacterium GW2011_GWA2_53_7 TaxID=1618650 RepID=A0A0G1XX08_9BACT|nr:MAG: Second mannosyl transferase [Candidatus Giovannonibacteria bacterium GW2011_GWA2_53_7]